jgi:hypothetical protein
MRNVLTQVDWEQAADDLSAREIDLLGMLPWEVVDLDEQNLPRWFPRWHPETGDDLSPRERLTWFNKLLLWNLSSQKDYLPHQSPREIDDSLRILLSKRKPHEILRTLYLIRQEVDDDSLPTPDSL